MRRIHLWPVITVVATVLAAVFMALAIRLAVEQSSTGYQAQQNEASAIAALKNKDGQIDGLHNELAQVLAAPTPAARTIIVNHYATATARPPASRPATPAPASTTTTTARPPTPCSTIPVVGTCVP